MEFENIAGVNIGELTELILELWPACSFDEEYANCKRILESVKETCILAKKQEKYIGFIYLSIRSDYVEGATSSPVVYIEGLYVRAEFQKSGVGRKLVELGEAWGKQKGCAEYASDAAWSNSDSIRFHRRVGFRETNRIVCFLKEIRD